VLAGAVDRTSRSTGGTVVLVGQGSGAIEVIELRSIEVVTPPSNKSMELTVKSVTPFARAKRAPLFPAAHARC
jgi:hypothetical protein